MPELHYSQFPFQSVYVIFHLLWKLDAYFDLDSWLRSVICSALASAFDRADVINAVKCCRCTWELCGAEHLKRNWVKSAETLQPCWQGTAGKQLAVIVRLSWLISIFGRAGEISLHSHLNVSEHCWNSYPSRPHKKKWKLCALVCATGMYTKYPKTTYNIYSSCLSIIYLPVVSYLLKDPNYRTKYAVFSETLWFFIL